MKIFFCLSFLLKGVILFGQDSGFPFGQITYKELEMKSYEKDTAAVAVVLNEYGQAYISNNEPYNLIFEYHIKIKILKQQGLDHANISIPLYRTNEKEERVTKILGSTFNLEGNKWKESKLDPNSIFTEVNRKKKDWNFTKFTLPDLKVGSVLDVQYTIETPFYSYKFRSWDFQTDLPKVYSEYLVRIPLNYIYNMTIKGLLKLDLNESSFVKDCYFSGIYRSDCAVYRFGIKDIPAFVEEEFMTAKSNFLSSINFELSEVRHWDGQVDKVTKEWGDADKEMAEDEQFGRQIRRAVDMMKEKGKEISKLTKDQTEQARRAFDFVKSHYLWNGSRWHFTDEGIKKAFESKKGNIAEINLTLLGLLKALDLEAYPVLISTRDNGWPILIHPVITDFNYVVVRLKIGDKSYWLDATNLLYPFGFLPEQCINGNGRLMKPKSEWIDLLGADKERRVTDIKLKMDENGSHSGSITITHQGYEAYNLRNGYYSFSSEEDYIKERVNHWTGITISSFDIENLKELDKPVIERVSVKSETENEEAAMIYFEPFVTGRFQVNPFRSDKRSYPVDFGAPKEEIVLFSLEYPPNYAVEELPKNAAITIPGGGGRYLFNISDLSNKISMTSQVYLSRSIYYPEEYFALKELFNRIVDVQQSQIVLKKK